MKKGLILLIYIIALAAVPQAHAFNPYLGEWQNAYPDSTTDQTSGRNGCQVCHGSTNSQFNTYGDEIRMLVQGGTQIGTAITQVEPLNSDADPTDSDNLTEVDANSQPGWTPGPNPIFDIDGTQIDTIDPTTIGVQEPLDPSYRCRGLDATIIGTEDDDIIYGTATNDVIVGLGGNDIIYGLGGRDTICGGLGSDVIFGGAGRDILNGESGDDVLRGQGGNDTISGGGGNDSIRGDAGDDILRGNSGIDSIEGGADSDTLSGGPGPDICRGGPGADTADPSCEHTYSIP